MSMACQHSWRVRARRRRISRTSFDGARDACSPKVEVSTDTPGAPTSATKSTAFRLPAAVLSALRQPRSIGHTAAIQSRGEFVRMFATRRERAQGLVEYGLIIALVAVLAIAGLVIFGPAVSSLLSNLDRKST